jgi:hypothetical protein
VGPRGIAVGSDGTLFVADGNTRIQQFTSTGGFITRRGSQGTAVGPF